MDAVTTTAVFEAVADVVAATTATRATKRHRHFKVPHFGCQHANPIQVTSYSSDSKYTNCSASGHGKVVCQPHP